MCRIETFQFEIMRFGLMNAHSTFQRMMNKVAGHLNFVRVYLDDVIIPTGAYTAGGTSHSNERAEA